MRAMREAWEERSKRRENSSLTKNVSDGAEVSHSFEMTGEGGAAKRKKRIQ